MKKKVSVGLAVLTLLVVFAGVALAQASDSSNQSKMPVLFQTFLEKLAANLGIEQSKLVEAVKQTELEMVDEAVQEGKMTSDQAQRMKNGIEEGKFFPLGCFHGPRKDAPVRFGGKQQDELARALGISVDELKAELQQGKRITDLAEERGLTADELDQKLRASKIQSIQQAVEEGKITQEKADKMIENLQRAPRGKRFRCPEPPPASFTEKTE